MAEKYEQSSPSLEGEEILGGPRGEGRYHDTDVFGHEENHDVRCSLFLLASKYCNVLMLIDIADCFAFSPLKGKDIVY